MKEDFYISLLYKQLNESISTKEEEQLSDWISASNENKQTAQQVKLAWQESLALSASPRVDLDVAFSELESKLAEEEAISSTPSKTGKSINFRRDWVKIAAAISFLMAAFLLGKDYFTPQAPRFTEIQTGTEMKTVTLPDNSTVQLNKDSKLSFPKAFSAKERRVTLEGEGFFEIRHNPDHPFIIETSHEQVKVLGTSFRVRAYKEEAQSLVQVATGKVSFRSNKSLEELILTPNQKGILNKALDKLELIASADPNEMSWGTKRLYFTQTSLNEVFEELETYYHVSFEAEDPRILSCTFTSTFHQEDLSSVLSTLSATLGIEFNKKSANTYQVMGGSCK